MTVLDRGEPGHGCSFGNAGWIVPSFSAPLPAPGVAARALSGLLDADSPFQLRLRALPALAPWLWRFWRHCNGRDHQRGMAALARLNLETMRGFDALAADGVDFEMHRDGVLFAFLDARRMAAMHAQLLAISGYGHAAPEVLRGDALRAREPALGDAVIGGLYVPTERHIRPDSLTSGLAAWLRAAGAQLRPGSEVLDWQTSNGRIVAALTSQGPVHSDHFVLATGARSGMLARRLGYSLPLQAGKGYSLTYAEDAIRLQQPLDLVEAGIVCSPFAQGWRASGTLELSGIDDRADARRIAALRRGLQRYLRLPPGALDGGEPWQGLRPLTPDGLPVIGAVPGHANGYIATGHAMLGMTLAPVTATMIADLIVDGHRHAEADAFDPMRFLDTRVVDDRPDRAGLDQGRPDQARIHRPSPSPAPHAGSPS